MLERRLVKLLGNTAKHLLGGMLHAIRAMLIASIVTAIVAAVATEVIASYLTHTILSGPADLTAAALAVLAGYAAGVTVAIEEIIRAFIHAIELIVEEAEKAEKLAVAELGVLGREAAEEALKVGKTALGDAGAVGHAVGGAVGGVVGGLEHDVARVTHHGGAPTASNQ